MATRAAVLMVSSVLALMAAGNFAAFASDNDPAARAAEERALRAQINHMDDELQELQSKLYTINHDTSASDASRDQQSRAVRDKIHAMDRDQELLGNRLRTLEKLDPPPSQRNQTVVQEAPPALPSAASSPPSPADVAAAEPLTISANPPPSAAAKLREAADPAIYEKAAGDWVSMFRYNPYRWIPVGKRQLAVFNSYDDAYLLDFDRDCPTLLTAKRIKVENFSTKVVMGRDAVVADGLRCPIVGIRSLYINRLPR